MRERQSTRVRLDPLDADIVRLLQQDARLSYREIAERLGSTTPTVSARVKALEDIGLLRRYRAELDPAVLGGTSYILTLTFHPQTARAALDAVAKLPGARAADLLPGGRIVARVHLRPPATTLAALHAAVAELAGLQTYDAAEVIHAHDALPIDDLPERVDVACHQCGGPIHGDPIRGRFGERAHVFCCRHCHGAFRERYERAAEGAAADTRSDARTRGPQPRTRG